MECLPFIRIPRIPIRHNGPIPFAIITRKPPTIGKVEESGCMIDFPIMVCPQIVADLMDKTVIRRRPINLGDTVRVGIRTDLPDHSLL